MELKTGTSSKEIKLLIFDWDGTLYDSPPFIVSCLQEAARNAGLAKPKEENIRYMIGLGMKAGMKIVFPELDEKQYPKLAVHYKREFLKIQNNIPLFTGVKDAISKLEKKYKLTIATGRTEEGLHIALQSTGMTKHFPIWRTAEKTKTKPNPKMLSELLNEFGLRASEALMIGDTSHDILMAQNVGMSSLALSYGAHTKEQLEKAKPDFLFASINDMMKHFFKL